MNGQLLTSTLSRSRLRESRVLWSTISVHEVLYWCLVMSLDTSFNLSWFQYLDPNYSVIPSRRFARSTHDCDCERGKNRYRIIGNSRIYPHLTPDARVPGVDQLTYEVD